MVHLTKVLSFAAARAMPVVTIEDLVTYRLAWGLMYLNRQSHPGGLPANNQLQTFSN